MNQIHHGFIEKRLEEISKIDSGQGAPQGEKWFTSGNNIFVRAGDLGKINNNLYVGDDCQLITSDAIKEYCLKLFPKNSIVFPKSGMSIMTENIALLKYDSYVVNHLAVVQLDNLIDSKYVYYFLKHYRISNLIPNTTSYPSVKISDIKKMKISWNDNPEVRKRIVGKLDNIIGQFIERKNKILQLQNSKNIEAIYESIIYKILQDLKLGKYSEFWHTFDKQILGELAKITSGGTPSRTVNEFWNGRIPWIKSGELLDNDLSNSEEHITQLALSKRSTKIFPPDTVLVALYGQGKTRGKTGRLLISAATNQACCAILPNRILNPKYLQYWIRSLYWDLRQISITGPQPNWNTNVVKNIEIIIPPIHEQEKIVSLLDLKFKTFEEFINKLNIIKNEKLTMLKQLEMITSSILNNIFTGKFPV